jgi:phosphoribosylanthranilate isomerase
MNQPEDFNVLGWAFDHAWAAVLALVGVVWKQNQSAMKAQAESSAEALQAHEKEDERRFEDLRDEQQLQRSHIGKLFDKLEEHGKRSEDRHVELLKALHEGLGRKADK